MNYTPSHNSCTASVILCKHALPHACLLYSHACVSVIVNADKHAFEYFQQDDLHSNTQQLHCICHVVHVRVAHSTSDLLDQGSAVCIGGSNICCIYIAMYISMRVSILSFCAYTTF